ncbi:hypothetical protein QTP70_029450 [Hemibagrus guttatus]|uniref:Protein lin-28 homolog A n=1 Tax=Hemibagrus guttatus TaxID=175788 RepID=A0AAE0PUP9_9TELE|nr:hypothetical protein QTP70_029450 [Hemibagrus guttatus]
MGEMGSVFGDYHRGSCAKTGDEETQNSEEDSASFSGSGVCKWFNVRMGFGFLSMPEQRRRSARPSRRRLRTSEAERVDKRVHLNELESLQFGGFLYDDLSKLHMDGFRSLKEGEPVEFTFKKSSKGLESLRVTGPGGAPCAGSEKRPKGAQKRRSKGDRCYNCGGPDHHAKECQLPPQPKKCHFCQSMSHMVANCPIKAQQASPGSQGTSTSLAGEEILSHTASPPDTSD